MKPWAQRVGLVQTGDNSITARGAIVLVALGVSPAARGTPPHFICSSKLRARRLLDT